VQLQATSAFAPTNGATADFVVARGGNNSGAFGQVVAPPFTSANGATTLSVGYPASGTTAARVTATVAGMAPTPAPAPSADICTVAPNSALCEVLSPPTASSPLLPVMQASNQVINTVVNTAPRVDADQVNVLETRKTTNTSTPGASKDGSAKNDGATKKMYCN